jgi:hypothetical protein
MQILRTPAPCYDGRGLARQSRMRSSIRSRAVAWPAGWILPLCRSATTSSRALPPPIYV